MKIEYQGVVQTLRLNQPHTASEYDGSPRYEADLEFIVEDDGRPYRQAMSLRVPDLHRTLKLGQKAKMVIEVEDASV